MIIPAPGRMTTPVVGLFGKLPARGDGLMAVPVQRGPVDLSVHWIRTSDVLVGRGLSCIQFRLLIGDGSVAKSLFRIAIDVQIEFRAGRKRLVGRRCWPGRPFRGLRMQQRLQHGHEDQEADQKQSERRYVAGPTALQVIARQTAGFEQQERDRLGQPPVQVSQPLYPLPGQMRDRPVMVIGVLAADMAIRTGQDGVAIVARGPRLRRVLGFALQQRAQSARADDLELPNHAPSRNPEHQSRARPLAVIKRLPGSWGVNRRETRVRAKAGR